MEIVTISNLESAAEMDLFQSVTSSVYRNDPVWAPASEMMWQQRFRQLLNSPGSFGMLLVMVKSNQPVARCMLQLVPGAIDKQGYPQGWISFFECAEDFQETAGVMLALGEKTLLQHGARTVVISKSDNQLVGILTSGFDLPHVVLTNHNPNYYFDLLKSCGYVPETRLVTLNFTREKVRRVFLKIPWVVTREFDRNCLDQEITTFHTLQKEIFERRSGYIARSDEEDREMVEFFLPFLDDELVIIAETKSGQPIGLLVCLPDLYQHLRGEEITRVRLMSIGVVPKFKRKGVGALMGVPPHAKFTEKKQLSVLGSVVDIKPQSSPFEPGQTVQCTARKRILAFTKEPGEINQMPRRQIAQLLLFVFIDVIGYSLFFPLLPYYAEQFGAGAYLVGLMIAANAAAQFMAAPIVGRLSDRFGRRPLIMVSILGTMLSFLLLALIEPVSRYLASNLNLLWGDQHLAARTAGWAVFLLFFCRILDGAAGGNVSLARAYISDITTEERRAQGLGLIGAAFGFGFVVGPAIGGTLSNWSQAAGWMEQINLSRFAIPAFAAVLLSMVNLVGVLFSLPELLPAQLRASTLRRKPGKIDVSAFRRLDQQALLRLLVLRFLFSLAITLFMANFAIFTKDYIGLSDKETSYLLTYAGVLLILVQAGGIGWLTRRYSEKSITFYAAIVVSVSLLCLSISANLASLVLILFPLALSGGVVNTIVNSLISKAAEKDKVGGALGLATSIESLTWIFAPIIGGALLDFWGGVAFALVTGIFSGLTIPYIRFFLLQEKTSIQMSGPGKRGLL